MAEFRPEQSLWNDICVPKLRQRDGNGCFHGMGRKYDTARSLMNQSPDIGRIMDEALMNEGDEMLQSGLAKGSEEPPAVGAIADSKFGRRIGD